MPKGATEYLARAYGLLASTGTTVCLLALMSLFFLVGTVFPQGAGLSDYAGTGGRLGFLVRLFHLLDIFASPLFILLTIALLLNLIVCVIERYPTLFARTYPAAFKPTRTLALTFETMEAYGRVREVLRRELKFKALETDSKWTIMEKGANWRLLTWLYHAGIIICFSGFIITYLFAYEGTVTVRPHKLNTIIPETTGRLKSLWSSKDRPTDFHILLDDLKTEYVQSPDLAYPDDRAARVAIGLGWRSPAYELHDDSIYAAGWKARFKAVKGSSTLYQKTADANTPFRYGGYSFHIAGWKESVRLSVDGNPILLEARSGEEIFIPGLTDPFAFDAVKGGKFRRLDGSMEELKSFAAVRSMGKDSSEYTGKVSLGDSVILGGRMVTLAAVESRVALIYRYDPGFWLVRAGGLFALVAMFIRFYGGWSMAAFTVVERNGIAVLQIFVDAKGLRFDPEKTLSTLEYHLTKDDLRLQPLPPAEVS